MCCKRWWVMDDALELLTGSEAGSLLSAAAAAASADIVEWTLRDVDHRPGDRTTTSYACLVAWPDGNRWETFAASLSGDKPPGGFVLTDGDRHVQVWKYPHDPALHGLERASDRRTVAEWLGVDPGRLSLEVVGYRPRKRAILEAVAPGVHMFIKVLRPRAAIEVERRHRLLTDAGVPVARCRTRTDDGVLLLERLPGTPLRDQLAGGLDDPNELVDLLDRLPSAVSYLPRRTPWAEHARHYADVVADVMPAIAGHVRSVASAIESRITPGGNDPTHGDFYDAQWMVESGRITGLLDVDTLGPGSRTDDLACAVAHASVLTTLPAYADDAHLALARWLPVFDRHVDPAQLRVRAAGVALSLATGPHRVQDPDWEAETATRVALAERWLDAADSKKPLMMVSE